MIMAVSASFTNSENMVNSTTSNSVESRMQMWQEGPPSCVVCGNLIYDRTMVQVKDKMMHSACLRCTSCHQEVKEMCFSDGNEVYCQYDFQRIFGAECAGCMGVITPTESVRRAEQKIYHQGCFCCVLCQTALQTGDKFYLRDDDKLLCDKDYDKLSNDVDSDSENISDGVIRKHRIRSDISYQQLKYLRHAYRSNPRPSRHIRREISTQTGLDTRTIQMWFQNKRSKERRRRIKGNNSHDSGLVSDIDDHSGSFNGQDAFFSHSAADRRHQSQNTPTDVVAPMSNKLQEWLKNLDSLAVDAVPPNMELKASDFQPNGEISISAVNWTHAQCQEQFWFQRQTSNTNLIPSNWLPGL